MAHGARGTRRDHRPGQFVDIALEGRYLRRPISVCDYDATTLTLIYKVVGEGTAQMSRMAAGGELDLLTGSATGSTCTMPHSVPCWWAAA